MAYNVSAEKLQSPAAHHKTEYGDFQTPRRLATDVCQLLKRLRINPSLVVEPNCGLGSFVKAATKAFPECPEILGVELNPGYADQLRSQLEALEGNSQVRIEIADFFKVDWASVITGCNTLILGNPPWVTSAALGSIGSGNLPHKSNFQRRAGMDAMTGKSNFDISEWMLIELLRAANGSTSTIAMLCKTAVARKVLQFGWSKKVQIRSAAMYSINAQKEFGAAVEACLLVIHFNPSANARECQIYDSLTSEYPISSIGLRDGRVVFNIDNYEQLSFLKSAGATMRHWRSGIKHDSSKVMELTGGPDALTNGLGDQVSIESDRVYPLLKSSDFSKSERPVPRKSVIVTQHRVGEDTAPLARSAPRTWQYLLSHSEGLDNRKSSIYRNRPRFSIFGVGDYSFAPWKVGISGFYKNLDFRVVAPFSSKPVMLDDTCYFLPARGEEGAEAIKEYLSSTDVQQFLNSFIFWDDKRPVKSELLELLDLRPVLEHIQPARLDSAQLALSM